MRREYITRTVANEECGSHFYLLVLPARQSRNASRFVVRPTRQRRDGVWPLEYLVNDWKAKPHTWFPMHFLELNDKSGCGV